MKRPPPRSYYQGIITRSVLAELDACMWQSGASGKRRRANTDYWACMAVLVIFLVLFMASVYLHHQDPEGPEAPPIAYNCNLYSLAPAAGVTTRHDPVPSASFLSASSHSCVAAHVCVQWLLIHSGDVTWNPSESDRTYSSVYLNAEIGTGHARSMLDSSQPGHKPHTNLPFRVWLLGPWDPEPPGTAANARRGLLRKTARTSGFS
jgi:hypothetical protein